MKKFLLLMLLMQLLLNRSTRCDTQNSNIPIFKKLLLFHSTHNPFFGSQLTEAINNKYPCPTEPVQLSVLNQSVQLTGKTIVNSETIALSNEIGKEIRVFTNQYRATKNLPPLQWDQFLAKVARPHTVRMARGVVPFSHVGFQQRFDRYLTKRPNTTSFGENLFYGLNIPRKNIARFAVNAWIQSPSHERNLSGNFNRIGVAVFKNSQNVWYISQLFALVG